jgi:hypothetical protein
VTVPMPCGSCGGNKVKLVTKVVLKTQPDGTQVPETEPGTETCTTCGGTGHGPGSLFVM